MDTDFRVITQALVPVPVELAEAVSNIFDENAFEGVEIQAYNFERLVFDLQNDNGSSDEETNEEIKALDWLEQVRRDVFDCANVDLLFFFVEQ